MPDGCRGEAASPVSRGHAVRCKCTAASASVCTDVCAKVRRTANGTPSSSCSSAHRRCHMDWQCQWPTHATPRVSIEPPQPNGHAAQKRKEVPASAPAREPRSRIQAIVTPTAAPSQTHPQGQAPPAAAARPTHAMPAAPSPATPGVPTPHCRRQLHLHAVRGGRAASELLAK